MKKYVAFVLAMVIVGSLFTGCGCSNSQPGNTKPSTLPPTTGATIMPTTEPATMPTTMATTAPTTEASTSADATATTGNGENNEEATATEQPTEATANNEARSRMPMPNSK